MRLRTEIYIAATHTNTHTHKLSHIHKLLHTHTQIFVLIRISTAMRQLIYAVEHDKMMYYFLTVFIKKKKNNIT